MNRSDKSTLRARELLESVRSEGDPASVAKALLELGRLDLREGDPKGARQRFRSAVATDDAVVKPEALLELGDLDLQEGDPEGARRYFTDAAATGDQRVASAAKLRLASLELSNLKTGPVEAVRPQKDEAPEEPAVTGLLTPPEDPPANEPQNDAKKGGFRRFFRRSKGAAAFAVKAASRLSWGMVTGVGTLVGRDVAEQTQLVDWVMKFLEQGGLM